MDQLFFFLSKVVWGVLSPTSVIVILLIFALLAAWRGWRVLFWTGAIPPVAALAGLAIYPFGEIALAPLERAYPANPKVDQVAGIVVLGGGEDVMMTLLWDQPHITGAGNRLVQAAILARQHPDARLIYSGGSGSIRRSKVAGAVVAREIFEGVGLPSTQITYEEKSNNTAENAAFSLPLQSAETPGAWLLVTSATHMPRAVETFCAAGWENLLPWPVDFKSGRVQRGAYPDLPLNLRDLNAASKEWLGRIVYRWTGRATVAVEPCLYRSKG